MTKNEKLKKLYIGFYGTSLETKNDFNTLLSLLENAREKRKDSLLLLDKDREWFFSENMIGMTLYIDLFAKNIKQLTKKVSYFKDLGITLIHLMPLLKSRSGENDGGYAVQDYRMIDSKFGSMDDFIEMIDVFRENGIYVCIDYVINHVAKEHKWAKQALANNKMMQDYFIMYDTDVIPNRFNQTVPEVLPTKCLGNFTYYPEIKKYVFTSFSSFQWDLNFKNAKVFNDMADNMLYLANLGVNIIRLYAIPFLHKELGTSCRNLAPIHTLLQMLNLVKDLVCPSVSLLGEAIVEANEIIKYFGSTKKPECEVMYNANLMVNIFNSFATKDVRLLTIDTNIYKAHDKSTWMNYIRCHDDIGWGFNEQAISSFGQTPHLHKQFLINFFGGDYPHTFAKGEHYQFNPINKDSRTNGTLASLLGLERALSTNDVFKQRTAIDRINLAHALILFYRGFPLIYSGDEIATLNSQNYLQDPYKNKDGRWLHRPIFDWKKEKNKNVPGTSEFEVYQMLKRMISIRKKFGFFDGRSSQEAIEIGNTSVYCLIRKYRKKVYLGLFNFSEHPQFIGSEIIKKKLSSYVYQDLIQNKSISFIASEIELSPYEFIWARPILQLKQELD